MSGEIVPFGKYKGQPIEAMAQDKSYCEWLSAQEWFRNRHSAMHTIIINNFAEPTETPEHNALQAKFTDKAFLKRFIHACVGGESALREYFEKKKLARLASIPRYMPASEGNWLRDLKFSLSASTTFETEGYDVVIEVNAGLQVWRIGVECKPSLGDDYPAVLRQIKSAKPGTTSVLVIGDGGFTAVGATIEQVRNIFGSIKIFFASDI